MELRRREGHVLRARHRRGARPVRRGRRRGSLLLAFPRPDTAAYWAFRAFRNFDGEGGRFEDELLPTAALEKTSLWASRDDAKKKIVLVLLNFSLAKTHDTGIALEGCGAIDKVRGFTYVGGPGKKLETMPVTPGANGVGGKFPPYSISVVEVSLR